MRDPVNHNLVIVGGGLAGMAAALALRNFPGRVALIGRQLPQAEQAAAGSLDQRSIGLSENSRQFLIELGVWESLESAAVPVSAIHISKQGSFGLSRIRASEEGVPALAWIAPASHLRQALWQGLKGQENLVCKIPATAQSLHPGDGQTPARLRVEEADGLRQITAQLIVLADGGQSSLHQQAGFSSQAIDYRQTAIVFNMAVTADTQRQVYERFTHRGLIALLPLAKNRCGVVWINSSAETQKLLAMRRTQFSRKLQETIGDRLGRITEIGSRQTYPLKLRWVKDVCHQRVLLMGNAAHTLHPVAAQGLNLSLRDVKFFAQQVLRGPQDPGRSIRQSDYRRRRRRDSRRVMAFTIA